jgi:hypothetical protein
LEVTTDLPPFGYDPPDTIEAILEQGGSEIGNSAVALWLSCQERSRLKDLGVERKLKKAESNVIQPLDDLGFGSLYHAISATRTARGQESALWYLEYCLRPQLASEDYLLALHMLKMNDIAYPLVADAEQFEYLGVEVEVVSDVKQADGSPCLRTVRYDKIIRLINDLRGKGVYSLEVKTSSKHGESALAVYMPQRVMHYTIWNSNPWLVEKYGPMHGVIFEQVSKTKIPQCERFGPYYPSRRQMQKFIEYLRLPDEVSYPARPDGTYPRQFHSCFGRFAPCEYIGLCWDDNYGDYEWP